MDLALYNPTFGYYARSAQRSGRAGDFFTSVDVGSLFGELLAIQIDEMAELLRSSAFFDLVEAGAGNGRLSADILRALSRRNPGLYARTRLHLVETSTLARNAHLDVIRDVRDRLMSSSDTLPDAFEGVLVANELFDALPVHQVLMRDDGLHEVYVAATSDGTLTTLDGPLSTPRLRAYLERAGVDLEPGWRVEINLNAVDWLHAAAERLTRGFMILIDYGHEARELYSASHAAGTLTSYSRHVMAGAESQGPQWLAVPGEQDLTAHVDFTSMRQAAVDAGMTPLGFLDQTYFLLGLYMSVGDAALDLSDPRRRMALRTLVVPGGLGSTMKVLLLGKGVGEPALLGCSYRVRAT
jgi:SAM-dependent MidA family methyltransferase